MLTKPELSVEGACISVVIPCYKVKKQILAVIADIPKCVSTIYVVDDCCPEKVGRLAEENCADPRVRVLFHEHNKGVGGATISGYRQALADGATVIVKIDGDGQMDPRLLDRFVELILSGKADYAKGNRFFDIELLATMPRGRLFGNSILSLINKATTGYWNVMDPTNGYTAIHSAALRHLPLEKLDQGYFFESDMLFRLNVARAVVVDVPMEARYGSEISNLRISKAVAEFPGKYLRRFVKRIFYSYFLRDFNAGTVELILGTILVLGGTIFGILRWHLSDETGIPATSGQVMLSALPILLGFQLLISVIAFDIANVPTTPLQLSLAPRAEKRDSVKGG
jgi:glycosyltransferase involved in cell wall biosynthesis